MKKYDIFLSTSHLSGHEDKYVFNSSNWINFKGDNVPDFESDLESYFEEKVFVAALSSGTAALHLALILLDIKAGDEVICQSMTFSASANPIVYQGAIPIFVDSESETWNMCPIALEEAIKDRISKGKKPKAIIAVHLYGMPYKHDQIKAISQKYQIPVVEDSAEALGSSYKKQKCGTLGDISILSFNGNKIITTSGGGALVTNDVNIKQKAVFLSTQARDDAPHYQHSHIGYNYRMSNICAGIGRGQMEVLNKHVELRRDMNQLYKTFFVNIPNIIVLTEPTDYFYSNHWLSAVVLESYEQREALRLAFEKANIETRPLWKPMHLQPVFKTYPYYGARISEDLFERGLCLPSGSNLTESEKERILSELQLFFQ
ncbi:aminotransferase class I/II-fold pyridoxal phosphate-dependent enzyme [Flavobacterium columnare]|uniref:Aminotransferase class I/II-fold pyridoxal phosphate-dependent enzyme n=1 Tax=Flavobacterium columnare TaxID=996 RepID=A0AA94F2E2_9FLAO|nr:aminotransferase class I/II-fold pyridoxal phosphate-dependent enzyme [Flavobacterium columnare]MCH4829046.1 aminotransferase class I/II-fold pyridoxal phosphate-dependent enzyme [Flavobacterium columnare]MCH4833822.1 aminotransferase class I/II-fold pyridoxal phosphate-dependent enzyme [Flavobacterium columnare]